MHKRIHGSRKGVYEVVEEVILFGVGIGILLGLITLFNYVEDGMFSALGESRLDAANKYVASLAVALHSTNCTRCYATIEMPQLIGGEKYTVGASPQGKTLIYSSGKYYLEEKITAPADGTVQSTFKALQVEYKSSTGAIKVYGATYY